MKVSPVTTAQWLKVGKTALWLIASTLVTFLATLVTDSPELFGPALPFVNLALVVLKQVFSEK